MDLSNYDMILWFLGEQSTEDETFKHAEQTKITEYIENGGALFVSGAEIGWDLDYKGDAADKAFFNETLNTKYVSDESKLYTFYGTDDFTDVSGAFDDGTYIYQAEYADVLSPYTRSGRTVLFYDDAMTLGAGILTKNDEKKVFVMGFPFETILDKDNKINLVQYVLDEFEITPETDDDPSDSGVETPDDDSDDDTADSNDETQDEDSANTENESTDEDTSDSENETQDEDTADGADSSDTSDSSDSDDPTDTSDSTDTTDTSDSSDSSDTSDQSDPTDTSDSSDSSDSTDTSDSSDTSENDKSDDEKGGCSVLTL